MFVDTGHGLYSIACTNDAYSASLSNAQVMPGDTLDIAVPIHDAMAFSSRRVNPCSAAVPALPRTWILMLGCAFVAVGTRWMRRFA